MEAVLSTLAVRKSSLSSPAKAGGRRKAIMAAVLSALTVSSPAIAAPRQWDGETSTDFSVNTNWVDDVLPANTLVDDTAVFAGAVSTNQPILATAYSLLGLDVQSAGWTIGGAGAISLGTGGLDSAGAGTNTINAGVTQSSASSTWTIGTGNTLVVNGPLTFTNQPVIAGDGNFVKGGTNNVGSTTTISGANTYTGTTTFRVGVINLNAAVAANTNGPFGNASSAVVLGDAGTLATGSSTTNVSLLFNAAGANSFGRNIDATGTTVVGRTRIGVSANGPATVDITGNLAVFSNSSRRIELVSTSGKTLTISGLITSSATSAAGNPLLLNGSGFGTGTIRLTNAANSFNSGVTVAYGALNLAGNVPATGNSPIGIGGLVMGEGATPPTNFSGGTTTNLQLLMENAGSSFSRTVTLASGATYNNGTVNGNGVVNAYTIGGTNTTGVVSYTGNINSPTVVLGDTNINLRAANGGTVSYTGIINDNPDATRQTFLNINLLTNINSTTLSGPGTTTGTPTTGTVILTGANTYQGGTYVRGGTLLANNGGGSATGTGPVNVLSGATLGGTGGFTGALSVASGGIVSPGGNAIESLGSGALTMAGGSTLLLDVNTNTATADLLVLAGALSLDTTTSPTLSLVNLDSGPLAQGTAVPIVTYTGAWNGGSFAVGGNSIADDVGTFAFGGNTFTIDYNRGGNTVALVAVPEPATAGLLGVAAIGLLARRRRR